jgi:uncharacterized protein (TIGR03118 family)
MKISLLRTLLLLSIVLFSGNATSISPVSIDTVQEKKLTDNRYQKTLLVANKASYGATFIEPDFINAWGIAIRPKGAGGHFWVGAGGQSYQYVGDVKASPDTKLQPFFQDDLKLVSVPGADAKTDDTSLGKITGVTFVGADLKGDAFVVKNQTVKTPSNENLSLNGSARFVFVTDSGKVSGWTELNASDGRIVRFDGPSVQTFDGKKLGSAFFGVAVKNDTWDKLWLADFGRQPKIMTLNKQWKRIPTVGFDNPFATGAKVNGRRTAIPGDPVPFNIHTLDDRVFVTYAISKASPSNKRQFDAGEEDALDAKAETASQYRPNKGKLVEYRRDGSLVRIYEDDQRLNAPWGIAIAPKQFGKFSNALLIGNFGGAGHIIAFDRNSGSYLGELRDDKGERIAIEGLWGLQFGNGASLGDENALYFAAGPKDETDGVFGAIRNL